MSELSISELVNNASTALGNAFMNIDDIKDKITSGEYYNISTELQKVFNLINEVKRITEQNDTSTTYTTQSDNRLFIFDDLYIDLNNNYASFDRDFEDIAREEFEFLELFNYWINPVDNSTIEYNENNYNYEFDYHDDEYYDDIDGIVASMLFDMDLTDDRSLTPDYTTLYYTNTIEENMNDPDNIARHRFIEETRVEWITSVYEFIQHNNMPIEFIRSKFNLTNEIDINTIYNCNCPEQDTACYCEGSTLNCKNIQHLILKYPLLIIPVLSDKYDSNILIEEYNKYFKFNLTSEFTYTDTSGLTNIEINTNIRSKLHMVRILVELSSQVIEGNPSKSIVLLLIKYLFDNANIFLYGRRTISTLLKNKMSEIFDDETRKKCYEDLLEMLNMPRDTIYKCYDAITQLNEELTDTN